MNLIYSSTSLLFSTKNNLSCSSFSISVHNILYLCESWGFKMIFQTRFLLPPLIHLRKEYLNNYEVLFLPKEYLFSDNYVLFWFKRNNSIKLSEKVHWKFIQDCTKCRWPKAKKLYTKVSTIIQTKKASKTHTCEQQPPRWQILLLSILFRLRLSLMHPNILLLLVLHINLLRLRRWLIFYSLLSSLIYCSFLW
jgi:hypothetical protein